MVLIYHRQSTICTVSELFFDHCQSLRLYEVNLAGIADLDDTGLVLVEFVVEYDTSHHPVSAIATVAGDEIS